MTWDGTYDLLPLEPEDPPEPVEIRRRRCMFCGVVERHGSCPACRKPLCRDCRDAHLEEDHPDELAELAADPRDLGHRPDPRELDWLEGGG